VTRAVLGLDIGGANLKAAHSDGGVRLRPFALWRNPERLSQELAVLAADWPPFDTLAVTMTGELCDCYESKRHGVHAILNAVEQAAGPLPVRVWRADGRFTDVAAARAEPLLTAAANWLVLAAFAGRLVPSGPALVIDIGSTTTDLVPLRDGRPTPQGRTDPQRLRCQELVYTGIARTPLCALLGSAGAAEWFATTLDVYLTLGNLPEDPANCETADGRPATRLAARARLARMLCADLETCTEEETTNLARQVSGRQAQLIRSAAMEVSLARCRSAFPAVVLAGSGEFLARLALGLHPAFPVPRIISLAERLGPAVSQSACAYAVCRLAAEGNSN
jgi:probable H4MPT-linked C1 transfer pathway protein